MPICIEFQEGALISNQQEEVHIPRTIHALENQHGLPHPEGIRLHTETHITDVVKGILRDPAFLVAKWHRWIKDADELIPSQEQHYHVTFGAPMRKFLVQLPSFLAEVPTSKTSEVKNAILSHIINVEPQISINQGEGVFLHTMVSTKGKWKKERANVAGFFGGSIHRIHAHYHHSSQLPPTEDTIYKTEGSRGFFGTEGITGEKGRYYAGQVGHKFSESQPWYIAASIGSLQVPINKSSALLDEKGREIGTASDITILFGVKLWEEPIRISHVINHREIEKIAKGQTQYQKLVEPFFDLIIN